MEPLSSFAISIAAGIVLEIYPAINKFRAQGVDRQIKLAFNKALKDWSINERVRAQKERELRSLLQSHIKAGDMITPQIVNQETFAFVKHFEKRLAEHTQAYDYLRLIVDQKKHDEVIDSFSRLEGKLSGIETLIKEGGIDPRDVGNYLDKIPFEEGKEKVEATIQHWYSQKEIDLELREVLLLATKKIFERTDELSQEIEELKSKGDTYLAEILEKIKTAVEERKPASLTAIYEAYNKKEKEDKIDLLNELIASSKAIFAYEEAIQFYRDLIELESTAENHFDFGRFLQEFNFFDESIRQYKKALELYRNLTKANSDIHMSKIAFILNNLALLHKDNNISLSLSEFESALKIYRDLSQNSPDKYSLYVAITLNNLANLYKNNNEYSLALIKYQEALELYTGAPRNKTPEYLLEIAMTLNNMAILHKDNSEYLLAFKQYNKALKILRNLVKKNSSYLPELAMILNNLALLHKDDNEYLLASIKYKEALDIRKELAEENPRQYLPYVATTLNNLANLSSSKNDHLKALGEYQEALKIRRDLAKENPRIYLPHIAMTLNNLALTYNNLANFRLAVKYYEESLGLYRKFLNDSPKAYEIRYAKMLLIGVDLFKKDTDDLKEAKEILQKYPDIPQAQKFLKMIDDLEKDKSP